MLDAGVLDVAFVMRDAVMLDAGMLGFVMLDSGCVMLDAGCWMLDAGFVMLPVDAGMLDCWMLDS